MVCHLIQWLEGAVDCERARLPHAIQIQRTPVYLPARLTHQRVCLSHGGAIYTRTIMRTLRITRGTRAVVQCSKWAGTWVPRPTAMQHIDVAGIAADDLSAISSRGAGG